MLHKFICFNNVLFKTIYTYEFIYNEVEVPPYMISPWIPKISGLACLFLVLSLYVIFFYTC
jgi:hypothetical protein